MSQFSCSALHTSLLVRDVPGHYLSATDDQILDVARQVIDLKMQRGVTQQIQSGLFGLSNMNKGLRREGWSGWSRT